MAVFFRRPSCFKRRLGLLFNRRDYGWHLTPLRALPLSYVVRCSQELTDKTNRSIGWFCLALLLIRHLQHRLDGGVFSASEAVSSVASACFQQTGLWRKHLTPLRALPLSYVVRCSQELQTKPTGASVGFAFSASPHPPFTAPS